MSGLVRRAAATLPWIALAGLALALRSLLHPFVFAGEDVRFLGGYDEFYHLRRIWFSVVHFPAVLDFDPWIDFPRGARSTWPPFFDWSVAALARLTVGPDQRGVEALAAWVPPVLGALTVLAVALLARRYGGAAAGGLAGLLLAVLPVHVTYSSLASIDHHVAVALLAVLLVGAAMRLAEPRAHGRWRAVVATGVLAAALILLWPGGLLHVLVVQLALLAQMGLAAARDEARVRARALAAVHAIAALLLAPFCLGQHWPQYGPLSPLVLTAFQPLYFACGAASLLLIDTLWRHDALGASRARRLASGLVLAAAGVALALAVLPGLAPALANGIAWFRDDDPFLEQIAEIEPLLMPGGRFDPTLAHTMFSLLFWLHPLAAGWLVVRALRAGRAAWLLLAAWSSVFLLLALDQVRWCDTAGPGFALVMGLALADASGVAARRLAPRWRALALAAALPLLGIALGPSLALPANALRAALSAARGIPVRLEPKLRQHEAMRRVGLWLREGTPPVPDPFADGGAPAYGVLSAWGNGHLLRYYGQRPLVQDNFGPYAGREGFDAARAYYASRSEREALAIARAQRARYVVATPNGSGQEPPAPGTMAARLALAPLPGQVADAASRGASRAAEEAEGFAHHRLVFVAEDAASGPPPWRVAVYEIVEGARVVGEAPPGTELRFELPLFLPEGGVLVYVARTRADAAGRYAIRLPHPTEAAPAGGVRTGRYRVRAGARTATLSLAEAEVHGGSTVAGPRFASGEGESATP